jgi:hypothetical protein
MLDPRCVIVANCCDKADFFDVAQQVGSDIRAAGMVAKVLGERLFMTLRGLHAALDCYVRNSEPLLDMPRNLDAARNKKV